MTVIECRSTTQIYEDNLCELHSRLIKWLRELRNERCFTSRELERKRTNITKMEGLVSKVEAAINGDGEIDICITERLGIKYSTML